MICLRFRLPFLLLPAVLTVSACNFLQPRPDPSRFFLLEAVEAGAAHATGLDLPSIGVGPLTLPRYLQRPSLVRRGPGSALVISEYDRWGEPLEDGVLRVLRLDLASRLHPADVVAFPWLTASSPDLTVRMTVDAFEPTESGEVVLSGHWMLRRRGGEPVESREFRLRRRPASPQPEDAVTTMSALLTDLGEELATALRAAGAARR